MKSPIVVISPNFQDTENCVYLFIYYIIKTQVQVHGAPPCSLSRVGNSYIN
jgi:hypothetical protein